MNDSTVHRRIHVRIASVATLASHFRQRSLFSVTMPRLFALYKATLIRSKLSFDTLVSIKCGFAKRLILEESLLNRSLLH
jgi:hypothetical protein